MWGVPSNERSAGNSDLELGALELENVLRGLEVAKPVPSYVCHAHALGQRALRQIGSRAGEQDLPAMSDHEHSRDAIERRTEVVSGALFDASAVNRHTDVEPINRTPVLTGELALGVVRGGDCVGDRGEGGAERIARRLEDAAAVCRDRRIHQRVVAADGLRHSRATALPTHGAARDVRKQEDNGCGLATARIATSTASRPVFYLVPSSPAAGAEAAALDFLGSPVRIFSLMNGFCWYGGRTLARISNPVL